VARQDYDKPGDDSPGGSKGLQLHMWRFVDDAPPQPMRLVLPDAASDGGLSTSMHASSSDVLCLAASDL
jgi:hypothetical protein